MTTRKMWGIEETADAMFDNGGGWVIYNTVTDTVQFSDFDCSYDLYEDEELIFEYWMTEDDDVWMLEEVIIPDKVGELVGCCFF